MIAGRGDSGSTSALGGALRGHALHLADLVDELTPTPYAATHRADDSDVERALLTVAADELDRVGALLQEWSSASTERSARLRHLGDQLAEAGLVADGNRVTPASGPSRIDPETMLASRDRLQELLNRVTGARAKDLARLTRELEASRAVLTRLSSSARSGAGPGSSRPADG